MSLFDPINPRTPVKPRALRLVLGVVEDPTDDSRTYSDRIECNFVDSEGQLVESRKGQYRAALSLARKQELKKILDDALDDFQALVP